MINLKEYYLEILNSLAIFLIKKSSVIYNIKIKEIS